MIIILAILAYHNKISWAWPIMLWLLMQLSHWSLLLQNQKTFSRLKQEIEDVERELGKTKEVLTFKHNLHV